MLRFPRSAIVLAALLAAPLCAFSQQPAGQQKQVVPQPAPSDAPPQLGNGDENGEPGVTIRQPENGTTVTEKRQGGEVREIKVRKGKNNTYYLHPNSAAGTNQRGTVTHPAQWVIKEFGNGSKKKEEAVTPSALPPAPPADHDTPEKK